MDTISQNPLNPAAFEIPDPPEEFGQDGGKFYRAYDSLAGEIDEDMTTSLKEQLDGMLIFAGLFAGINTAFLALTIPLLSADPSDDTNALLNSILLQLAIEKNTTVSTGSELPSAGFSPSRNISAINTLFALSLAFAIISSFLAVLGRQWLVYYRKRSGGGPDRQRWEQLKRLLGAQRWRMELILDDVLPALLQLGLIIFCISLLMYLHYLSPAISVVVGIPMYCGLAIFVASALCTLWDRFCPFHSPLSHLLCWGVQNFPFMVRRVNAYVAAGWRLGSQFFEKLKQHFGPPTVVRDDISFGIHTTDSAGFDRPVVQDPTPPGPIKRWLQALALGREEETLQVLEVIALRRAICTSDDPATLLNATANIIGITDKAQIEQMWSDLTFQERLLGQMRNSHMRVSQMRNLPLVDTASSVRRIYCAAIAHISLTLDFKWDVESMIYMEIQKCREAAVLISVKRLSEASTPLIQTTLGFAILQFCTRYPSHETARKFLAHFVVYSDTAERGDWGLLGVLAWVASMIPSIRQLGPSSLASLRQAYRGDFQQGLETFTKAFNTLSQSEFRDLADGDRILTNLLKGLNRQANAVQHVQWKITLQQKFALLEICEPMMRNPGLPEEARQIIRKTRFDLGEVWNQECAVWASRYQIREFLPEMLHHYLLTVSSVYEADSGYLEWLEALQVFRPCISQLFSHRPGEWMAPEGMRKALELLKTFNKSVLDIDRTCHQIQRNIRRVRNPDERWCHRQEPERSIRTVYSLSPAPPDSDWDWAARRLGFSHNA